MNEKNVKSIILTYEDGSTEIVYKGLVANYIGDTVTFNMVGMGGMDLAMIVESVLELGDRLGLFDHL